MILRKNQHGFCKKKFTASQILTTRRILEGLRVKNIEATILLVNFSIHRGKMEQILLAYGLPHETVAAIMMLYKNTKVKVRSSGTDYVNIVTGVPQGDTLALYLFISRLDNVLRTYIDKRKDNGFKLTKERSRK